MSATTDSVPQQCSTWLKLGFQGHNPRTDFRGGGILSLACMVYFAEQHTTVPHLVTIVPEVSFLCILCLMMLWKKKVPFFFINQCFAAVLFTNCERSKPYGFVPFFCRIY